MKSKKIIASLALTSMLFSTVASFAEDRDIWSVSPEQLFATKREFAQEREKRKEVAQNEAGFYFEAHGHLFTMKAANEAFAKNPEGFLADLKIENAVKPVGQEQGLEVVSVAAVSKTVVNVEFSKKPEKPLGKEDFLKLGVEGIEILSVAQGAQETVYTLTVKELKGKGTIKIGGKSVDYDFTAAENTGVLSVTLDNYRHITVKFAKEIDAESIGAAKNYYFELVQGSVGEKLGAQATMEENKHYSLDSIGPGKAVTIEVYNNAELVGNSADPTKLVGKKGNEARISFHNEARLGNQKTGKINQESIILMEKLQGLAAENKSLDENTKVFLSTRNLKEEGKKVFDTSVNEITIIDQRNPEILKMTDKDGNALEYEKKPFKLQYATGQKLMIEYNEPIGVTVEKPGGTQDLMPMGLKVRVNGKNVAATKTEVNIATLGYHDARVVQIDLDALATLMAQPAIFGIGKSAAIEIRGIRDVAGNLGPDLDLKFDVVKNLEDEVIVNVPAKILGVKQVKDNMFVVFATKKDVTGILEIENADKDGKSVKAVIPFTKIPTTFKDKDGNDQAAFASFVEVATTGLDEVDKLSYKGKADMHRKLMVNMPVHKAVPASAITDDDKILPWVDPNFLLRMDDLGPHYKGMPDANESGILDLAGDLSVDTLSVAVEDVVPEEYWKNEYNKYDVVPNEEDGNGTNEAGLGAEAAFTGTGRLQVSYTKNDGTRVLKSVDLGFGADAATFDNTALNKLKVTNNAAQPVHVKDGKLVVDLGLLPGLPGEYLEGGNLVPGATYTLDLPKALVSDEKYTAAGTTINGAGELATLQDPVAGGDMPTRVTAYETAYNNLAPALAPSALNSLKEIYFHEARTDKRGIVSAETKLDLTLPGAPGGPVAPSQVPQTSMRADAVKYIKETNELQILFTGEPTIESLKNLKNYSLNGQTFESLGAKPADVLVINAVAGTDQIAGKDADYVVRIKVPKNSVKSDGPASVTIENIEHPDGGKMARVFIPAVENFEDNTSPVVVEATYAATGHIKLLFDEAVRFLDGATLASLKRNFKVEINGVPTAITNLSITAANNKELVLEVGSTLTAETKVKLTIQNNGEGNMEIEDEAKNTLDPEYSTNKDIQLKFVP